MKQNKCLACENPLSKYVHTCKNHTKLNIKIKEDLKQNKDCEEFRVELNKIAEKWFSIGGDRYVQDLLISINELHDRILETHTQKKIEESKTKIFKDLLKIADKGEIEDLRREVTSYFKGETK